MLVVGRPKGYNTVIQNNPKINAPHDPFLKTKITALQYYKEWTQRKPMISATTGSNLNYQRVVFVDVIQASTSLLKNGIYTSIALNLLHEN